VVASGEVVQDALNCIDRFGTRHCVPYRDEPDTEAINIARNDHGLVVEGS